MVSFNASTKPANPAPVSKSVDPFSFGNNMGFAAQKPAASNPAAAFSGLDFGLPNAPKPAAQQQPQYGRPAQPMGYPMQQPYNSYGQPNYPQQAPYGMQQQRPFGF